MREQFNEFIDCDIFIKKITSVLNSYPIMPKKENWVHKKDLNRTSDCLLYILDGEAMLCPGKEQHHVKKNDIVYIPAKEPYSSYGIKFPFYYIQIMFLTENDNLNINTIIKDKHNYFLNKFQTILNKWQTKNFGYKLEIKSILYSMLAEIMTEIKASTYPSHHYEIIKKANDFFQINLTNPDLSVEELIAHMGISGTYLRNIFNDFYNTTPSKYLCSLRIALAKDYLKTTELSVSSISEKVGFLNVYHFSNTFKKVTGESPLNYRKKHKIFFM